MKKPGRGRVFMGAPRGAPARPDDQAAGVLAGLAVVCGGLTAVFVSVWKLASATSAACLVAFCTLSIALVAAAMADFTRAAADSVPAGAFLTALSTALLNLDWTEATCASVILLTSALVVAAMSYRWRP